MTETTQPDPQVVAWMREYLRDHPRAEDVILLAAYRAECGRAVNDVGYSVLAASAQEALTRTPLTLTDIPAGQGPASLFLRRLERSGKLVAWYRANDIEAIAFMGEPEPHAGPAEHALWDHLVAHLPHVTTEESA